MSLIKKAKRTTGAFFSLKDLVQDGPVLVLFRLVDFLAPEKATGYDGTNVPVIADALVCSGPRKGEVHLSEKFIGAITAQLRGVANPNPAKNRPVLAPENEAGELILARVKLLNPGKSNESAGGDEPSDIETSAVEQWYDPRMWAVEAPDLATAGAGASNGAAASDKPWLK